MANQLQKANGQKFYLEMGNGANPEVFTRIGLVNTSLNIGSSQNLEEAELPDLDDFDLPYAISREVRSQDLSFEAAGAVDHRYVADMLDLHIGERAGETVNLKLKLDTAYGFTVTCGYILSDFGIDATYKTMSTCQMSWKQNGRPTFTKNVPSS